MASKKKLLQAAAGSAGGAGLDVDEVFSTYVYDGSSSGQTITNGIDLSGEGGMVWTKDRTSSSAQHALFDTERGVLKGLASSSVGAEANETGSVTAFNSNGYTLGTWSGVNYSGIDYVSWTFRKAPKFFDIQTWTGNGTARAISHNLGSTPGMVIYKNVTSGFGWQVYHRGMAINQRLELADTGSASSSVGYWDQTTPVTSAVLNIGTDDHVNKNGDTFVAYLFAHNDSDGEFGPDADQDIIKCGSYTGDGTTNGTNEVTLGFEPQWIFTKRSDSADNWHICDVMREQTTDGSTARLRANTSAAESSNLGAVPTATGFKLYSDNSNGGTYIFMAIRRGPLAEPTSATDVFAIDTHGDTEPSPPAWNSGFPVDMAIYKNITASGGHWILSGRLTGTKSLKTNTTDAEGNDNSILFDYQNGYYNGTGSLSNYVSWMWKRAPGYFDVTTDTGTGSAKTVTHGLTVPPEMIWRKHRTSTTDDWFVYHKGLNNGTNPHTHYISLNSTNAEVNDSGGRWNAAPTASVFSVGSSSSTNQNTGNYITWLFATVAGVSKVGSYVGNSTDGHQIDCGFSNGARFVLLKNITVSNTNWLLFDTVRGIVAGNDSRLYLNTTDSENTGTDYVDPHSSGFIVDANAQVNYSGSTYIFYAIA